MKTDNLTILGRHAVAELVRIEPSLLRDAEFLTAVMESACRRAGATVLYSKFHKFGGEGGVTGVVLLSESHASIHTWPEHGYAAVDVFMCGSCNPNKALVVIKEALDAATREKFTLTRGVFEERKT